MGKLRTFFRTFFKSLTSPSYYAEIVKTKFLFSLKFFFFYFLLYSLVLTAYLTPKVFIPMDKIVRKLPDTILEIYPAELTIKIKNGQVSTNVKEPYSIPIPQNIYPFDRLPFNGYQDFGTALHLIKNNSVVSLLTIDTQAQVTDILKYNTLALLTKESFSIAGKDGKITTYPLREAKDVTINKLVVFSVVQALAPYLKYIVPSLVFLFFWVFLFFIPLSMMSYLAFFSLVILVLGKIMNLHLGYGKYYQIGLHTLVVWVTLEGIMTLFGLRIAVPFFGTGLFLLLTIIALKGIKEGLLVTLASPPPPPSVKS